MFFVGVYYFFKLVGILVVVCFVGALAICAASAVIGAGAVALVIVGLWRCAVAVGRWST